MLKTMSSMKSVPAGLAVFYRRSLVPTLILGSVIAVGGQIPAAAQVTTISASVPRPSEPYGPCSDHHNDRFWNLPGAVATFPVVANTRYVYIARFTAESVCFGASGWCPVRILINGVEMDLL